MNKNQFLITAAMAGIVGACAMSATSAFAGDKAKAGGEMGLCSGTTSCSGKSACKTADNACKGQNGCKGKGATEMSKAKCEKIGKKNKAAHFFPAAAAAAPAPATTAAPAGKT